MGWLNEDGRWRFRSDDPRAPRAWVEASPDRSRLVVLENHGEHHPGAESIVIVPDRPIAGVSRFHTTNGAATIDPTGTWLIIEGVIGFVAHNLSDGTTAHYEPDTGALIAGWSLQGGVLEWKEVRAGSATREVKSCALDEIRARWAPGLGRFSEGVFQPDDAFTAKWDRWSQGGGRAKALLPLPKLDREREGAFTIDGNRSAGLLAFGVVITTAVIAGLMVGVLSGAGLGSDLFNLFVALVAMIGLAPGLLVAEAWVRHPRWIHFGSDTIVVRRVLGEKRCAVSQIADIRSLQYAGTSFRFPLHVMVIFFKDSPPLRIDSDMLVRSGVRDVETMASVERRVRQMYEMHGTWTVAHRRYPELSELVKAAAGRA